MPILPPEPMLSPNNLFDSVPNPLGDGQRWWVLHARPRTEKCLARVAFRDGISYFLPHHVRRWRNKGRLFSSSQPLFPGYVFVRADDSSRVKLQSTGWVANVLPVGDQRRFHSDLQRIHELIAMGAPLTPESKLVAGARVRIGSGPFSGLEGTILRRGSQLRLLVEVHFMQQGVSVEIESWMAEAIAATTREAVAL